MFEYAKKGEDGITNIILNRKCYDKNMYQTHCDSDLNITEQITKYGKIYNTPYNIGQFYEKLIKD